MSLPHLLVEATGEPNGVIDFELARRDLQRNVVAVVPHFLVAPPMLRGTDMVLTLVEGLFREQQSCSELRIFDPPFELPDYRLSAMWDEHGESDKALIWFRSLISSIARADQKQLILGINSQYRAKTGPTDKR